MSHIGFHGSVYALLVAGRVSSGDVTYSQARALAAWAQDNGLLCVPSGDLSSTGAVESDDARAYLSLVLGKPVLSAEADDGGPSRGMSIDELRQAVAAIEKLDIADHGVAFADDIALHAVSAGPLCAGMVAFGKPSRKDANELVRGADMQQEQHDEGVLGVELAFVSYNRSATKRIDLSAAAHDERVSEAAAAGVKNGAYHVVAAYDVT
jgi:hypothetical protein